MQATPTPNPAQYENRVLNVVRAYLKRMVEVGGSDLHIKANAQVRARIKGDIQILGGNIFSKEDALDLSKELLRGRFGEFVEHKEIDLVYPFDEKNAFSCQYVFSNEWCLCCFSCDSCRYFRD